MSNTNVVRTLWAVDSKGESEMSFVFASGLVYQTIRRDGKVTGSATLAPATASAIIDALLAVGYSEEPRLTWTRVTA